MPPFVAYEGIMVLMVITVVLVLFAVRSTAHRISR